MKAFLLFPILFSATFLIAQTVGINSTGAVPSTSAMLDVSANDKGLLIPRVNIIDLNTDVPVTSPVTSLLVYNTNGTSGVGYYFWNGSKWVNLKDSDSNADEDWHEVGTTTAPDDINDDVFTMGKVGIGVNVPLADFHLKSSKDALFGNLDDFQRGSVHIRGGENEATGRTGKKSTLFLKNGFGTSTSLHIVEEATSSGHIGLFVGNEDKTEAVLMTIHNKVGIGTMNPGAALHISMDNTEPAWFDRYVGNTSWGSHVKLRRARGTKIVPLASVAGDRSGIIDFQSWDGANFVPTSYLIADIEGTPGLGDVKGSLEFWTSNGGTISEKMRVTSNGFVGIGVIAPQERLEVNGNLQIHSYSLGADNGIYFRDGFNSTANPYNLSITTDNFNGDGTPDALSINGYEGVSISTGHNTSLQRRLTIINNGNVGIGTSAPGSRLHVTTPTQTAIGNIRIVSGNSNSDIIDITGNSADVYLDHFVGATFTATVATVLNRTATFKVDKAPTIGANVTVTDNMALWVEGGVSSFGGDVGIGTTSPTSKLHVVGIVEYADNAAAIAGGLTIGAFYRTGDLLKIVH